VKHYIQDGGLRLRLQSAYDLLRELQRKRDLIYMFFSHDLRVVAALAGHLIVMRRGKVVEEGPPAERFKNSKSKYTRGLFAAAFRIEGVPGV
jgi:microcin C transport system ATP-binding protein